MKIRIRIVRIANDERIDVSPLNFGGVILQHHRALDRLIAGPFALGIDWQIVIRPKGQGDTPLRHRQFWIELGRAHETTAGFVVIKSVNKFQSLIEKLLGFLVFGRNRMMDFAQAGN